MQAHVAIDLNYHVDLIITKVCYHTKVTKKPKKAAETMTDYTNRLIYCWKNRLPSHNCQPYNTVIQSIEKQDITIFSIKMNHECYVEMKVNVNETI